MALAVEAAELMEPFQWLTEAESAALPPEMRAQVEEEMGDVLLYLVRVADGLDVDWCRRRSGSYGRTPWSIGSRRGGGGNSRRAQWAESTCLSELRSEWRSGWPSGLRFTISPLGLGLG
jgi:hypothetical protein